MEWRNTSDQGARDAAGILPVATAILLLPPIILIFAAPGLVGGAPLILIYIFSVWAIAILVAACLARRLGKASESDHAAPPDRDGTS